MTQGIYNDVEKRCIRGRLRIKWGFGQAYAACHYRASSDQSAGTLFFERGEFDKN